MVFFSQFSFFFFFFGGPSYSIIRLGNSDKPDFLQSFSRIFFSLKQVFLKSTIDAYQRLRYPRIPLQGWNLVLLRFPVISTCELIFFMQIITNPKPVGLGEILAGGGLSLLPAEGRSMGACAQTRMKAPAQRTEGNHRVPLWRGGVEVSALPGWQCSWNLWPPLQALLCV